MDDSSGSDVNLNEQSLNQSVGSSVSGLGPSFWNEYHGLGNGNDSIEERFRQLKAATVRAGLTRRWRRMRNLNENRGSVESTFDMNGGRGMRRGEGSGGLMDRNVDRGKGCKRESSLLVAMALEMDSEVKKVPEDCGNFYDCNICLNMARDPILTCCGHLFCWACFCKLPYVDSTSKECPACEGEVTDSNIIPIYGNGDSSRELKLESGMTIPPRPKARRVESARQQRVSRGVPDIPVAEALRRIRSSINAMGENPQQEEASTFGTNHTVSIREEVRLRSRQLSRIFSDTVASLSSVSSALNNAERFVEDLETYLHNRRLQRSDAQILSVDDRDTLTRNAAVSQLEHQISAEEISSAIGGPSAAGTSDNFNGIEQTENMTTITASELNLPTPHFHSPSRRRNGSLRDSD
ncbi:hypothetical protein ACH5RR_023500 [Cinchona calisaya]|uniref:E3 ubiquitin-protein ligase RMA n=1 Tax=Cinchona calisaya TaxID=153742 RepID=A0ABD2ZAW8_9GENT